MLLLACTPKLHVFSAEDPVAPAQGSRVDVALRVLEFKDSRRSGPYAEFLFLSTNEPTIAGKRRCVNGEKWYEPNTVAREVSQGVAHHIEQRGLVKVVSEHTRERPLYALHGNVRALYVIQEYHLGSAIGSQFGLIGAAFTYKNKSLGNVYIELNELKLLDERGKQVASLPPVVVTFEGAMPIDAYCVAAYTNAKEHFRRAAEQLAENVEHELARLTTPPPAWGNAAPAASAPTSGGEAPAETQTDQAPLEPPTETTTEPVTPEPVELSAAP